MAEWREAIRIAATEGSRLELEVSLIDYYRLTLPPATEPWDESAREEQIERRSPALWKAKEELRKARSGTILDRVFPCGYGRNSQPGWNLDASLDHLGARCKTVGPGCLPMIHQDNG